MIEALILIHLWSLVVAASARVSQRDRGKGAGGRFPTPRVWFLLIVLSVLPGVLYFMPFGEVLRIPDIEILDFIPTHVSERSAGDPGFFNPVLIYGGVGFLLMIRTLRSWSRLQRLPLVPTTESDVFTTTADVPPLTLSWPRRAVVLPSGFQTGSALVEHERAHLHHHDAELTLALLLLQDLILHNPGIRYLVEQWRLSIELRADRAATETLTASERKDYAALLLNLQRPRRNGVQTLPCPSAHHGSRHHRALKMRLGLIIGAEPGSGKQGWAALAVTFMGACAVGITASANTGIDKAMEVGPVILEYVRKTPLQMPANCVGLKTDDLKAVERPVTVDGRRLQRYVMKVGVVTLYHDVRTDGSVHNPRIAASTHPCFEAEAEAAVVQWIAESQGAAVKDAAAKLPFVISGATPDELRLQLDALTQ